MKMKMKMKTVGNDATC